MSNIPDISDFPSTRLEAQRAGRLLRPAAAARNGQAQPQAKRLDSVELSAAARAADSTLDAGPVRGDLVASIREQIAAGTYETEDRLNRALEALVDDLSV